MNLINKAGMIMNKKIIWYVLNKIRFVLCIPFLMVLGLITCPLTLLFKWQGLWILWIANAESCSLSEAKKILKDNVKYPDIDKIYYNYSNQSFGNTSIYNDINHKSTYEESSIDSNGFYDDYRSSLAYSWSPVNIHYDQRRDN